MKRGLLGDRSEYFVRNEGKTRDFGACLRVQIPRKTQFMAKSPISVGNLSFEKALAELEDIIQKLESGGVELEKSIELYERGAALKAHCDEKLRSAQERIEKIVAKDGAPATEPASFE